MLERDVECAEKVRFLVLGQFTSAPRQLNGIAAIADFRSGMRGENPCEFIQRGRMIRTQRQYPAIV